MIVGRRGTCGTIGGGHLEFEALRIAQTRSSSDPPPARWLVRFPLAARLGQCCGGVATARHSIGRSMRTTAPGHRAARRSTWRQARRCRSSHDSATVAARIPSRPKPDATGGGATLVLSSDGATLLVHAVVPSNFACSCSATATSAARSCRCWARYPRACAGSTAAKRDFPASVPANVEIVATDAPESEIAAAPRGAWQHSRHDAQPRARLRAHRRRVGPRRLALSRPHRLAIQAQPVRASPRGARLRARSICSRHLSDRRIRRHRDPQQGTGRDRSGRGGGATQGQRPRSRVRDDFSPMPSVNAKVASDPT